MGIGEYVLPALPRTIREKVTSPRSSWNYRDILTVAKPGRGEVRLLIAPTNSASQAYYWARAAETMPGVSARNLAVGYGSAGISVRPDVAVRKNVGYYSRLWARRQRRAILKGFTHVLYEAERAILPAIYGSDLRDEIDDLRDHGITVGMICHGSDVRTPSEHALRESHSPFGEPLDGLTQTLEKNTAVNRALLSDLKAVTFVSTLDLLQYVPSASWLPTLTDPSRWLNLPPIQLGSRKPVVAHIPSRSALKGTAAVRAAMHLLQEEGLIEYVEVEGIPYEQMPQWISRADVVIDQVSMGLYGVASVEAMLAGRLVVAQAGPFIREKTKELTGWSLPIIEANPDTIEDVIRDIARDPTSFERIVDEGRQFALEVHSRQRVCDALGPFLFGGAHFEKVRRSNGG